MPIIPPLIASSRVTCNRSSPATSCPIQIDGCDLHFCECSKGYLGFAIDAASESQHKTAFVLSLNPRSLSHGTKGERSMALTSAVVANMKENAMVVACPKPGRHGRDVVASGQRKDRTLPSAVSRIRRHRLCQEDCFPHRNHQSGRGFTKRSSAGWLIHRHLDAIPLKAAPIRMKAISRACVAWCAVSTATEQVLIV